MRAGREAADRSGRAARRRTVLRGREAAGAKISEFLARNPRILLTCFRPHSGRGRYSLAPNTPTPPDAPQQGRSLVHPRRTRFDAPKLAPAFPESPKRA